MHRDVPVGPTITCDRRGSGHHRWRRARQAITMRAGSGLSQAITMRAGSGLSRPRSPGARRTNRSWRTPRGGAWPPGTGDRRCALRGRGSSWRPAWSVTWTWRSSSWERPCVSSPVSVVWAVGDPGSPWPRVVDHRPAGRRGSAHVGWVSVASGVVLVEAEIRQRSPARISGRAGRGRRLTAIQPHWELLWRGPLTSLVAQRSEW